MAKDYPDYSPSYLVRYGAFIHYSMDETVTTLSNTKVGELKYKGIIYGGYLYIEKASSGKNDIPQIRVDGQVLNEFTFEELDKYNITRPGIYGVYSLKFDDTNFIYVVAFNPGITFEKSISVWYEETYGDTPLVKAHLDYARLE